MRTSSSILVDAVATLAMKDPGILRVWSLIHPVIDDRADIAYKSRIDGDHLAFVYNPALLEKVGCRMASRFVYMECLRLLLGHYDKRRKPDMAICKLASDIVTGTITMRAIPPDGETETITSLVPTYDKYVNVLARHHISYPNENFTIEAIYDALMEENETIPEPIADAETETPGPDGEPGDKQQPPDDSRERKDDPDESKTGETNKADGGSAGGDGDGELPGECDGSPCDPDGPDNSSDGQEEQDEANAVGGSACNGDGNGTPSREEVIQDVFRYVPPDGAWNGTDDTESQIRNIVDELERSGSLREIVGASLLGAVLHRFDTAVKKMKNTLRRFTTSVSSAHTEESWMRPNRRYDDDMPGYRTVSRPRVLLAVDVSGSMEINVQKVIDILRHVLRVFDLDVCFWNESCSEPVQGKIGRVRVPSPFGGTRPECVMELVRGGRTRYDGFVFVTDCDFTWLERPPEWKKIAFIRMPCIDFGDMPCSFPDWSIFQIDSVEIGV